MKRENPQLRQIEGLVKELLEREGLTAEGGPWGDLLPKMKGLGQGGLAASAGLGGGRLAPKLPPFLSSWPPCSFPGKIEIKIVRPGTEGTEEDARWLTDEDTRNLKEIFFNILVSSVASCPQVLAPSPLLWHAAVLGAWLRRPGWPILTAC